MAKYGPAPIQINWDEFDKLASYQCTQPEIAAFFNISVDTLERAYLRDHGVKLADVWDKRKFLGKVRLRKVQFEIAESKGPGAATMAIFLGKVMLNQNDKACELPPPPETNIQKEPKTFAEFCVAAKYPSPFEKQCEMREFAFTLLDPRLLLGSRGYGKTDYITILGTAYEIYLDWFYNPSNMTETNLIITKSRIRNTAMIDEIGNALELNGVPLEKRNASIIKVQGLIGKDSSVEAITIKTSMRGRHPKRVLMDDPVTEEDVSDATRQTVQRKYNEVMKLCSNVVIIGQPAHRHDLYAKLRGIVRKMEVPFGSITELDHDLEAQRLAGVDENSIQMSYFLKIPDDGTTPFDKINRIDEFPTQGTSIAFIDPSHEGGDYTALSIIKQYGQGVAVVGFTFKKAWNHCLDEIIPKIAKYGVAKIGFETNSLGDQPIIMLRQLLANTGVGVTGRRTLSNKHSRIMAAGSFAHLIHLSKESDKIYTDQVIEYEYKSKHDDAPDSMATALEWIGLIKGRS